MIGGIYYESFIKKVFVSIVTTTMLAVFAVPALANDDAVVNSSFNEINQEISKDEPVISPRVLLISQTVNYRGEGTSSFGFYGGGVLRFYLANTGNQPLHYTLQYPNGQYLLGSAHGGNTISAGRYDLFSNLDVEAVHGSNAYGQYRLYVWNDDGSTGSFDIEVRSIER